jgi:hypothetical protein
MHRCLIEFRLAAAWRLVATLCVGLFGIGMAAAQQLLPDPPLNVYLHTVTENGQAAIVVIYRSDHTYSSIARSVAASTGGGIASAVTLGRGENTGRWWIQGNSFCWTVERGPNPRTLCKSNGHYIGQQPIPGWTARAKAQ